MTDRRIRIGNQTAFSVEVLRPFEYAAEKGFDAFEWFPDKKNDGTGWEEDDVSEEMRKYIRERALSHDILLTVHVSLQSCLGKEESGRPLPKAVVFAKDIGASLLTVHLSSGGDVGKYVESIIPLAKLLGEEGMKLAVENTVESSPGDFNMLFRHIRERYPEYAGNIGICLDLGHANLCSATRNDYLRFIDMLDEEVQIVHMHLHENYGDYDSHLTVFTGPAGKDPSGITRMLERLKKRDFSGCIILEQWPRPEELLVEARNRLLEMIASPVRTEVAGKDDFVETIADADSTFRSWRKKLEWIQDLLIEKSDELTIDQLVYIAVYLRFVGTGAVPCMEDGGHYRPSYHAKISSRIYKRLVRMTTPENAFIIRKIYPWLPSFETPFLRAEPLTLIRDIAHRNDIPGELKREIKQTLQNKLHRSAGPEDLATSAAILERITAPGADYPTVFVGEFRRFHEELKEFFNARSLDEQLSSIAQRGDFPEAAGEIGEFLRSRDEAASIEQVLQTLEHLTRIRGLFNEKIRGDIGPEAQRYQISDIKTEEFSFVLMSRFVNFIEEAGEPVPWPYVLRCLGLAVANLRLSGFDNDECLAIESEISAWSDNFDAGSRDELIRLYATLDRCRRLSGVYSDKILSLFPEKAERLGRALGVAVHSIKVFSEAEIRGHPVLQLSRIVSFFSNKIRALASPPPWDIIVQGTVRGRLASFPSLAELSVPTEEPVIALLERVEGDEEIPLMVFGIIVTHETPLLSHLAVRARQRGITFAACDDAELISGLRGLIGKRVVLAATGDRVKLEISSTPAGREIAERWREVQREVQLPVVVLTRSRKLLPLAQVTCENGGSKAYAALRLEELSQREGQGFRTPPGFVIPFGVMEECLTTAGLAKEYRALVNGLEGTDKAVDDALKKIREIIADLRVPHEIISSAAKHLSEEDRLMVRSSSNGEDVEGLSGAGLYDSVPNVSPSRINRAVRLVWSSLWNRRAVTSRMLAGIAHEKIHMAVLIQRMLVPDLSFIMHTVNPLNNNRDEVFMELAVGLGETLASGATPGIPFRIVWDRRTGGLSRISYSSFSTAAWPGMEGGVIRKTVDHSEIELSRNRDFGEALGTRLGKIGVFVEESFGKPQDIEGLVAGDDIYLVQSRPQH